MTPRDLAEAFLAKGDEDLRLLQKIGQDRDISDDTFGFHVQQALEKYLKALLALGQTRPQRTHDLGVLLDEVALAGLTAPEGVGDLGEWTPYAIRYRYPFLAPAPAIDREAALGQVERVRDRAAEAIAREEGGPPAG